MQVDPNTIKIRREERQRKTLDFSDLVDSFARIGQLHPVVVEQTAEGIILIAGERRLRAALQLGWTTIEAVLKSDLTQQERDTIELEENIKRQDLSWQERALAIAKIHSAYSGMEQDWSMTKTAERIGLTKSTISESIAAAEALEAGDAKIVEATSRPAAMNIIRRRNDRAVTNVLNQLTAPIELDTTLPTSKELDADDSILHEDFNTWAREYSGPPFTFIHCDPPYGVNLHASKQVNLQAHDIYHDSQEVFEQFCATLVECQDKLLARSASIMFWFDMAQYTRTFELLANLDFTLYKIPLVWHKSDNKGILSDPNRRARHIYEVCLYGHRGDIKNVEAVSDVYSCPIDKAEHISLKPEPMLRHFMRMFVDGHTRMLDPTCGSGSALRAAESLGAKFILGIERDAETVAGARAELQLFRNKRRLAELAK